MRYFAALLLLIGFAPPAHAEWHRIETDQFALQADMEPEALHAIGVQLLDHDRMLRQVLGITGPGRGRRLEMIIYGDRAQLISEAGMPPLAAGFFHANPIENFALLPARDSVEDGYYDLSATLRHEYAHDFMVRHLGSWQPGWFIEGFATFFSTAARGEDGVMRYGAPPEYMAEMRGEFAAMPFAQLSATTNYAFDEATMNRFYGQGWAITSHYYLGGPQAPGIGAYLDAVSKGRKADAALLFAGGATQLDRDVDSWLAAGLATPREIALAAVDPAAIRLRPMRRGEVDLIGLRLDIYRRMAEIGSPQEAMNAWSALIARGRALVAANPGDRVVGNFVAKLLLADLDDTSSDEVGAIIDPAATTTDDRILQARLMTRRADEGPPAQFQRTITTSRALLQKTLTAEPSNVDALFAMFENVREAEGASPKATQYLAQALAIRPDNAMWRMTLLELYLRSGRTADAIKLLEPIANQPHGGRESAGASELIRMLRRGR